MSVTPSLTQSLAKQFMARGETARIYPPVRRGTSWIVAMEMDDALDGPQRHEKVFRTEGLALDFYTELYLGQSKTQAAAAALDVGTGLRQDGTTTDQVASAKQSDHRARREAGKAINLRKVTEVLSAYGLDPTEELVDVLTPVPCVDPDTGLEYVKHRLAPEDRAKILLELLQYAQPKLKAVEMKIEGTLAQMTQEQIDNRLRTLVQAAIAGAK